MTKREKFVHFLKVQLPLGLKKTPMLLLGLPAAYGTAKYSYPVYHEVSWLIGAGVESVYIAAVLFAHNKKRKPFFITVTTAVICSVIYNTLFAALMAGSEKSTDLISWLFAAIHGAPLSILTLVYAVLMHPSSDDNKVQVNRVAELEQKLTEAGQALLDMQSLKETILRLTAEVDSFAKAVDVRDVTIAQLTGKLTELEVKLLEAVSQPKQLPQPAKKVTKQLVQPVAVTDKLRVSRKEAFEIVCNIWADETILNKYAEAIKRTGFSRNTIQALKMEFLSSKEAGLIQFPGTKELA